MKKLFALSLFICLLAIVIPASMAFATPVGPVSADDAIVSVKAIGFVDTDGAKLSAIDIEYNVDMNGADVTLDKYTITDYGTKNSPVCEIGSNPGVATGVHVENNTHVIIEVNTAYQLAAVIKAYQWAMMAGVLQTGTITTPATTITPGTAEVKNYEVVEIVTPGKPTQYRDYAIDGTYTIEGTEDFQLFTKAAGTAFHATDCWEEKTGQEVDVDLPYALYVPADYDPSLEYALVLHIHDAGFMGDDPMIALTESQGPVNFASSAVQQIAKDDGLGGIIVVCPQIADALRSTRDDYSLSAAVPATWQLMDSITGSYNIDTDRIYGEGQSMGGMQVGAMAAQRDNYFAAWWANGCQWGSNFTLDDPTYNKGVPYYQAPQTGDPIWTVDADGNPVNYRNWYYLVSDDNILINNCKNDNFSTSVWKEFKYLYKDLAGAEIPYTSWNPLTTSKPDQNTALEALFAQPNDLGIYWAAFDGGNHMATWIYSHGVSAAYDWLLSQTRQSEMDRDKLDLNKPFEKAAVQLRTGRSIAGGTAYLATGQFGAGTLYYNSALYGKGGATLVQPPAWWPLQAGAGSSPIVFPASMFDPSLPNLEGFNGVVHDNPYARVLVLNNGGTKVALCSLELVNIPAISITDCKNVVSAQTGVPVDNVWVHATHAITTPHYPGNLEHSPVASEVQAYAYYNAVHAAITDAAEQAADSYHNALAGWETGTCDVNMNRDVEFPDGKWYIGLGGTQDSNKTMTLLRVDSTSGDPIGFMMSYGIKPTCIDNSEMAAKTRQISSDVPGLACRLMEEEFGAPALFFMPAAADQVPKKWCWYQAWDAVQNKAVWVDEGVANGLAWVNELGTIMGNDAIGIADSINTVPQSRKLALTNSAYVWPKKGSTTPTETVTVGAIRFGDAAFVGFKPELNYLTEQQLWAASPYTHTILISFLNGDQKYMPDKDAYNWGLTGSAEAQKSGFAPGAAEQLRGTALTLLNSLTDTPTVAAPAVTFLSPNSGDAAGGTSVIITGTDFTNVTAVTFGGTAATSFIVNSPTQITATTPVHVAGVVDVVVTAAGGASEVAGTANDFTYVAHVPTITKIAPAVGSTTSATSVVITGTDFNAVSAVTFGGTAATSYVRDSATQITAIAPPHAVGMVQVQVTTIGGVSVDTSADDFHYLVTNSYDDKNPKNTYVPAWSRWDNSGFWAASGDTYGYTDKAGAKLIITFEGSYLSWVACTSNTKGKAKVTVDPGTAEAKTVTVDLYSASTRWKQTVYSTDVLDYGTHTVVIECLRQKNPASSWYTIDVDRFDIAGTLLQSPTVTKVDDKDSSFTYAPAWSHWDNSGFWAAYLDTYAYTDKLASKATFAFDGTYASWVACTSSTKGKASVKLYEGSVDPGNLVSTTVVDLYSPSTLWKQNVYDTGVLAPGSYTVVIECLREKNAASAWYTIDVDRFDVMLAP